MYDDMTYSLLVEMVVNRLNLAPNIQVNLSFQHPSFASQLDITNNDDVKLFVDCASKAKGGIPHLYVGQKKETRIISGPTGVLQAALLRKHADVMEGRHENVLPTQEYVRQIILDPSEDDYFTSGPWLGTVVYLHEGVMASGCLGNMKNYCNNGKLDLVVGVIMSCKLNALGDLTVTLKEPSGTMGGTIH
ncbi:hypothetical protein Tco_1258408 [Tanacetum coccineum]